MVDSVLLLVDAQEGPMPQTRFVTQRPSTMACGPSWWSTRSIGQGARPDWVIDQVFELFDRLGATDEQLDFPIIYASALNGYADLTDDIRDGRHDAPLQGHRRALPAPGGGSGLSLPDADLDARLQQLRRRHRGGAHPHGSVKPNQQVVAWSSPMAPAAAARSAWSMAIWGWIAMRCHRPSAGDIVALTGIEAPNVSDTLCDPEHVAAMPQPSVDEPTVTMTFQVNTSPFAGREGKYLTSRQLKDRLERELIHNVALRVEEGN